MSFPRKQSRKNFTPRAELARLLAEPMVLRVCPHYENPKALLMHGVGTMVRLCESENQQIAQSSAQWVVAYAQNLLSAKRQDGKQNHELVIAELRALYAKALPKNQAQQPPEPLIVEATEDEKR